MLPEIFLERMQRMLGDEYEAFLQTFEQEKYRALRLNPLKSDVNGRSAAEILGQAVSPDRSKASGSQVSDFARLSKVPWAENGYYYQAADQPGKHPYHEAGLYYIQEPSAMAPVELLEVKLGERVLDLCAAPGGKSTQIAAKLQGKGFLLCNEIHPARAKILSENVERMGISNACVTNETPERLAELFSEYFDKVLVDAPCSGEGMFRKNEAACEEWSPENVARCAERQDEILDCAARMLRPGGKLVYSTCTFAPEENEGSIGRFVQRHREFEILPIQKERLGLAGCSETAVKKDCGSGCDGEPEWSGCDLPELKNTLRLWPQRIKGEGHFAAVIQKAGSLPEGYRNNAVNGTEKGLPEKELGEFAVFCRENLRTPEMFQKSFPDSGSRGEHKVSGNTKFIKFGTNLYLVPADMPSVKGMKVLRPGLHVGEMKKNRFEPSHALALALAPSSAANVWNLDSRDETVRAYLNGQTFRAEGQKGWYLICVDGFGIGWGKLSGGIMKNHYPKGLRANY